MRPPLDPLEPLGPPSFASLDPLVNLPLNFLFMFQIHKQKHQQMNLTPAQHEQLQQQTRLMHDNWNRLHIKLYDCDDPQTTGLSSHLSIPCEKFRNMLIARGQSLVQSLYDDTLNVEEEKRFARDDHNVDPVKWIQVIAFLRDSLRSQYQQPVLQDDSQILLEQSPDPRSGRPTPFAGHHVMGVDIPEMHNFDQIKSKLDTIFAEKNDIFTEKEDKSTKEYQQKYEKYEKQQQYSHLIFTVLGKPANITHVEYDRLFGGQYTPQLMPVHLLESSFRKHFRDLDTQTAFNFACRAYLDTDPKYIHKLEMLEPLEPRRLYVIARLMRSFANDNFDRTEGMRLGGNSRLRSKKRGRKSIRRRKSMHRRKKSIRR